jgi:hypothetical protein
VTCPFTPLADCLWRGGKRTLTSLTNCLPSGTQRLTPLTDGLTACPAGIPRDSPPSVTACPAVSRGGERLPCHIDSRIHAVIIS